MPCYNNYVKQWKHINFKPKLGDAMPIAEAQIYYALFEGVEEMINHLILEGDNVDTLRIALYFFPR